MYGNLKKFRESIGMTQKDFAASLSVKLSTYNGYETGAREPKSDFLISVAQKYNVTIDYLMGRSNNPYSTSDAKAYFIISDNEITHIKKYRALDEHGKKMIDMVLAEETERIKKAQKSIPVSASAEIIPLPKPIQSASAGYGDPADDETAETIYVYRNNITAKADYIMNVDGNSMEPKFFDGQQVLVRQQPAVEIGEIGIFIKEGMRFIKIYRGDHMESANPEYKDEPFEEYSKCMGKVLGVLQDEWIVKE